MPEGSGFAGCIKNLTFTSDGKSTLYDLGNPADGENYTPGCNEVFAAPVIDHLNLSFLIAFIVVFALVIVAVIVAAVYRRKQNLWA